MAACHPHPQRLRGRLLPPTAAGQPARSPEAAQHNQEEDQEDVLKRDRGPGVKLEVQKPWVQKLSGSWVHVEIGI